MQVAAQKYMTLKMKPASGTSLAPYASSLNQEMVIQNTMEGQKPLSLKLKINYVIDNGTGVTISEIKIINNLPNNY